MLKLTIIISCFWIGAIRAVSDDSTNILEDYKKCSSQNDLNAIMECAGLKLARSLDEFADTSETINIMPGIELQGAPGHSRNSKSLEKAYNEITTPGNPSKSISDLIIRAFTKFISGRTLKLKIPEATPEIVTNALEEGRAKMKKMNSSKWMMGIGGTVLASFPLIIGAVALFATKALIVGKLALVLSIISFVQYFFGSNGLTGLTNTNQGGFNYLGPQTSYGVPTYSYGTNSLGLASATSGYP